MKQKKRKVHVLKKHRNSIRLRNLKTVTLGMALRSARIKNKYSQLEFSKKIGLSNTGISNVEAGRHFPSPQIFKRMCKHLKLDFAIVYSLYYREYMERCSKRLKCYLFSPQD